MFLCVKAKSYLKEIAFHKLLLFVVSLMTSVSLMIHFFMIGIVKYFSFFSLSPSKHQKVLCKCVILLVYSPVIFFLMITFPLTLNPDGGHSTYSPKSFVWQLDLNLQPTNQPTNQPINPTPFTWTFHKYFQSSYVYS